MSMTETPVAPAMAQAPSAFPLWTLLLSAGALLALSDHPASAHIVGQAAGFSSGFEHPLTGLDHFLAMLSVGIWGAQMGGRSVWTLPVTFPMIMALGGFLGMSGVPLPGSELGIAVSILVLGSAIAMAWHPREFVALAIVAIFAIFHGYAHGVELPRAADPAEYAVGFVLATGMVHLVGIGVGLVLAKPFEGVLARALGAAIVLGGLYFLFA